MKLTPILQCNILCFPLDNILHFVYFTDASSINTSSTVPKNSRTDKTEMLDVLCLYFLVLVCIVLWECMNGDPDI